jgi:uncharacterized alkaline shock family protein YloU
MEGTETITPGKVIVAPEVLITIAKLATLSVQGVAHMAAVPGGIDRYFKRGTADGVRIHTNANSLSADLYIVVRGDANAREVSEAVQTAVSRAMSEMVGMETSMVNVHIEDFAFTE